MSQKSLLSWLGLALGYAAILLVGIFLLKTYVFYGGEDFPVPMGELPFSCSKDEECVVLVDKCNRHLGIHKDHSEEYAKLLAGQTRDDCMKMIEMSTNPVNLNYQNPEISVCRRGECKVF